MRFNFKLLSVLVLLAAAGVFAQSKEVDEYLQKKLTAQPLAGISVAVVQDGKAVYAKGVGMANVENNVPATENTVYQLASITKQFTATGIMILVEEGKIGLDEPVSKYLANLPAAWQPITIRQLLTHTSGIPNYTRFFEGIEKTKDYSHEEILKPGFHA
jgi:CubicO group peptidase (beta-lactamase class C family)